MRATSAFAWGLVLGLLPGAVVPSVYFLRRELSGYPATHVLTAPLDLGDSYAFKAIAAYPEHGERVPSAPMIGRVEAGTRYALVRDANGDQYVRFSTILDGDVLKPISRAIEPADSN